MIRQIYSLALDNLVRDRYDFKIRSDERIRSEVGDVIFYHIVRIFSIKTIIEIKNTIGRRDLRLSK